MSPSVQSRTVIHMLGFINVPKRFKNIIFTWLFYCILMNSNIEWSISLNSICCSLGSASFSTAPTVKPHRMEVDTNFIHWRLKLLAASFRGRHSLVCLPVLNIQHSLLGAATIPALHTWTISALTWTCLLSRMLSIPLPVNLVNHQLLLLSFSVPVMSSVVLGGGPSITRLIQRY